MLDNDDDKEATRKFLAARHARRLAANAETMTVTGLRMSDPDKAELGAVVCFDEEEQEIIMDAVRSVLAARQAKDEPSN